MRPVKTSATVQDLARIKNVSERWVRDLCLQGRIECHLTAAGKYQIAPGALGAALLNWPPAPALGRLRGPALGQAKRRAVALLKASARPLAEIGRRSGLSRQAVRRLRDKYAPQRPAVDPYIEIKIGTGGRAAPAQSEGAWISLLRDAIKKGVMVVSVVAPIDPAAQSRLYAAILTACSAANRTVRFHSDPATVLQGNTDDVTVVKLTANSASRPGLFSELLRKVRAPDKARDAVRNGPGTLILISAECPVLPDMFRADHMTSVLIDLRPQDGPVAQLVAALKGPARVVNLYGPGDLSGLLRQAMDIYTSPLKILDDTNGKRVSVSDMICAADDETATKVVVLTRPRCEYLYLPVEQTAWVSAN